MKRLAQSQSALQAALHADILLLAQSRRTPVCRNYPPAHPRGTFDSVAELEAAIVDMDRSSKRPPETLHWTAKRQSIIAKYRRAKKALANLPAGDK